MAVIRPGSGPSGPVASTLRSAPSLTARVSGLDQGTPVRVRSATETTAGRAGADCCRGPPMDASGRAESLPAKAPLMASAEMLPASTAPATPKSRVVRATPRSPRLGPD